MIRGLEGRGCIPQPSGDYRQESWSTSSADPADSCSVPICRKARNQGDEHGRDQEAADYDNHGRFHLNHFGASAVMLELWSQRCMRQALRQRAAAGAHFGA